MTREELSALYTGFKKYMKSQGWTIPSESELWEWEQYRSIGLEGLKFEKRKVKKL